MGVDYASATYREDQFNAIARQSVLLPTGLNVPNTSLVLGETTCPYAPLMDFMHMGTLNLYSSIYMLPRFSSGTITLMP
jgi:hypothetical protein